MELIDVYDGTGPRPRVRIVMPYRGGTYLMEELQGEAVPENRGKRRFVGGGVEVGETLEEAAVRELGEELGFQVVREQLTYLGSVPHPKWDTTEYFFLLPSAPMGPGTYPQKGHPPIVLVAAVPDPQTYLGGDPTELLKRI